MTSAHASAPSSSANLGPGFDCLALALEIRCQVWATPADGWKVEHVGAHRPGAGAGDAVLDAAQRAVGERHPLALTVDNEVPIARGLGSSSAAAAAGAMAAWRATGVEPDLRQVFEVVADMEGHPDNAAATVYGGLVLATSHNVHRLPWSGVLRVVVAIPDEPFPTPQARATLPAAYPADTVVRSLGRVASLVAGLLAGDGAILDDAQGDEIHESTRSHMRPDVAALISTARRAGAVHASWSGAGPSVLALVDDSSIDHVTEALSLRLGEQGEVIVPSVATEGTV